MWKVRNFLSHFLQKFREYDISTTKIASFTESWFHEKSGEREFHIFSTTVHPYLSMPCLWFRWAKHCSEMERGSPQDSKAWLTRICWDSSSSKWVFSSASFFCNSVFQKEISPTLCLNLSLTSFWSCFVLMRVSLSNSWVSSSKRSAASLSVSAYWLRFRFLDVHSG